MKEPSCCRCSIGAAFLGSLAVAAIAVFGWRALSTDVAAAPGLPGDVVPLASANPQGKSAVSQPQNDTPVVNLKTWEETGKPSNIGH